MRPSEALSLHRARIREIVLSHRVSGVRVFGSALRGDDVAGSDLDLLVEPTPSNHADGHWRHPLRAEKTAGLGGECPYPQWPACQLSRTDTARRQARMSRAHPLRIADYLQHLLQALNLLGLQKQIASLS